MRSPTQSRRISSPADWRHPWRRQSGMNLIELMVTLSIAAMLFAVGVPSYKYITNSSRVASEINALLGDMTLARAEAIRQGLTVSVCPSNNGTACVATGTWSQGWIVFTDFNGNGVVDSSDTTQLDTVLRHQPAFSSPETFTVLNVPSNYVSFNREGFTSNLGNTDGTHGVFELHTAPPNNQYTRCLDIWLTGQMTVEHYGQSQVTNNITTGTQCQ